MTESALAPTPPPVDSPRVLVVDDDNEIREILRITLESEGYQVDSADSGEGALEAVSTQAPALIILDARLPGRDGFDICRTLKADARVSGVPVIMISANSEEESRVRGLKAGATDFLAKPFYPRELLTKVYRALQTAEEQTRLTQRTSVLEEMAEKQRIYGERYPIDEDFLAALGHMPPASGAALGFDRLVMLATGAVRIEQVIWTPVA